MDYRALVKENPFTGDNPFAAPLATAGACAAMAYAEPSSWSYAMLRSGPRVSADEVELANVASVEVMIRWDANTLHVAHLTPPRPFVVGDDLDDKTPCDFFLPGEWLGSPRATVVLPRGLDVVLVLLPRAHGYVELPGEGRFTLDELIATGQAQPSPESHDAHEVVLPAGAKARMELADSGVVFLVNTVNAGRAAPAGLFTGAEPAAFGFTGLSFLLHVGVVAVLAFFMPGMRGDDAESLDRDRILTMQKFLDARQPERETEPQQSADDGSTSQAAASGAARAPDEEGSSGKTTAARNATRKQAVAGPRDNPDPHLAKAAALQEAASFGMAGLASMLVGGNIDAPTVAWGRDDSSGKDDVNARGNMFGETLGDAFGTGGLGLTAGALVEGGGCGAGRSGCTGIGLQGFGTLGTSGFGVSGLSGDGVGGSHGRLRRHPPAARPHHGSRRQRQRFNGAPSPRGHPAHRPAIELRPLSPLLRNRHARQPEPRRPRDGEVRHRPHRKRHDHGRRRQRPPGCERRAVRRAWLRQPVVSGAPRRHDHRRLPARLQPGNLIPAAGQGAPAPATRQFCGVRTTVTAWLWGTYGPAPGGRPGSARSASALAQRTRRSSVTTRRSSVTTRRSSVTTRRSSVTTRRSSVATRRSSVATRRSSVATETRDGSWAQVGQVGTETREVWTWHKSVATETREDTTETRDGATTDAAVLPTRTSVLPCRLYMAWPSAESISCGLNPTNTLPRTSMTGMEPARKPLLASLSCISRAAPASFSTSFST